MFSLKHSENYPQGENLQQPCRGWNVEKRLQQHKNGITTPLNSNIANVSFDSALSSHVFENPNHKILLGESALTSNDLGVKQVFQEAIEIRIFP